jgi:hypothetical protein
MNAMTASRTSSLLISAVVLAAGACSKPTSSGAGNGGAAPAATPVARAASPPAREVQAITVPPKAPPKVGMEDPFVRMNSAAIKTLDSGWKALRKKKYSEARAAFQAVVAAYPDKPAARFQELRAAALEGDFRAVPGLWRELLARDFVGYAKRLDNGKEMAPLRASPQWAELEAITAEVGIAYAAGLGRGVLFVARTHVDGPPKFAWDGIAGNAKLDLNQEVYHFDPESKRIRRLSDSGGQVVAVHRDGDKREVMLLLARALKRLEGVEGTAFSRPEAALLSLDTLEQTAPLAIDADATAVDLCWSAKGEPVWTISTAGSVVARSLTPDATAAALVPVEEPCGVEVATTIADPKGVEHRRAEPEGVALSNDGLQLTGIDDGKPLRASQAIRPGSFSWSPGKKRFVYTGKLDRCTAGDATDAEGKPLRNSLYVWDTERKKTVRVKSARASYETLWLDDDHLAFESGAAHAPTLTIHDFADGASITLKTPAGAALFGMPALPCEEILTHAFVR